MDTKGLVALSRGDSRESAAASTRPAVPTSRRDRIDDIRCDLLVDFDRNDTKLGLIDNQGFISERALTQYKGASRPPIRDALAALVARNVLSVVPAKGYRVELLTKDVIDRNRQSGFDSLAAIQTELGRIAETACERLSTAAASQDERSSLLKAAAEHVADAEEKAKGNLQRNNGEAIFHCTEAIGHIASAAGLQWGPDNLRSGLDILEISLRWNRDRQRQFPFEKSEVNDRINLNKTILDALSGKKVSCKKAQDAFARYLSNRVDALTESFETPTIPRARVTVKAHHVPGGS
jgi:DNA-binding GntR family transcriptional regulator